MVTEQLPIGPGVVVAVAVEGSGVAVGGACVLVGGMGVNVGCGVLVAAGVLVGGSVGIRVMVGGGVAGVGCCWTVSAQIEAYSTAAWGNPLAAGDRSSTFVTPDGIGCQYD
jgi:hypothetical protein